jgi:hypothetical protein
MGTSNAAKNIRNQTFPTPVGRTLIQRIEIQMDKRRSSMEKLVLEQGSDVRESFPWALQRGRYEGFAATLSILRSTSVQEEISRSNERLGIS